MTGNILIFEDDLDIARQWSRSLEERGHQVTLACSGTEAIAWCVEEIFDLVIIDMYLIGPDGRHSPDGGLRLTNRLRHALVSGLDDHYRIVPILAVTASPPFNGFDILAHARRSGANRVLRKPFSLGELVAEVEGLLLLFADDDQRSVPSRS